MKRIWHCARKITQCREVALKDWLPANKIKVLDIVAKVFLITANDDLIALF